MQENIPEANRSSEEFKTFEKLKSPHSSQEELPNEKYESGEKNVKSPFRDYKITF